jgi:hypothetical protein
MKSIAMFGALAVFAAAPLAAQGKFRTGNVFPTPQPTSTSSGVLGDILGTQRDSAQHRRKSDHIPPGQLPPAGMCRIWIDGVPPGRQPAPTDCQTAVATKPANARVIWGDQTAFPGKGKGKLKQGKSVKGGDSDADRDEGDDDFDRDREEHRSRGRLEHRGSGSDEAHGQRSSLAKRGKKG